MFGNLLQRLPDPAFFEWREKMLIQGGTLVLEDGVRQGDIRLEGERIVQVGGGMSPLPGEDVEDARGCWVVMWRA